MSPKERRAYALGYRFALRKARRELDEVVQRLDAELCRIDGEQRAAREQTARQLNDEVAELVGEMKGMRDQFHRLKAIEHAIDTERDFDTPLN